jgi:hypothetical protein
LLEGAQKISCGTVDQDIDVAMFLNNWFNGGFNLGFLSHVAGASPNILIACFLR